MYKIGYYKNNPVFIEKNKDDKTWTIRLEHHKHGVLEKTGLKFMPKLGMAKRFFKSKIDVLNNGEKHVRETSNKYSIRYKADIAGTGEKLTPDEIRQWIE